MAGEISESVMAMASTSVAASGKPQSIISENIQRSGSSRNGSVMAKAKAAYRENEMAWQYQQWHRAFGESRGEKWQCHRESGISESQLKANMAQLNVGNGVNNNGENGSVISNNGGIEASAAAKQMA
jgi:hypothetical protein